MALSKDITATAFGKEISFPNSYIKVKRVFGDKENMHAEIVTLSEKDGDQISSAMVSFVHDVVGDNVIKQAYEHLKTIPEFAGATDV